MPLLAGDKLIAIAATLAVLTVTIGGKRTTSQSTSQTTCGPITSHQRFTIIELGASNVITEQFKTLVPIRLNNHGFQNISHDVSLN